MGDSLSFRTFLPSPGLSGPVSKAVSSVHHDWKMPTSSADSCRYVSVRSVGASLANAAMCVACALNVLLASGPPHTALSMPNNCKMQVGKGKNGKLTTSEDNRGRLDDHRHAQSRKSKTSRQTAIRICSSLLEINHLSMSDAPKASVFLSLFVQTEFISHFRVMPAPAPREPLIATGWIQY